MFKALFLGLLICACLSIVSAQGPHELPIAALGISADGKVLLSGSNAGADGKIPAKFAFWDASSGKVMQAGSTSTMTQITAIAFSGGSPYVAVAGGKDIMLMDLESGSTKTLAEHTKPVKFLRFDAAGKRLISGSGDAWLMWNVEKGSVAATIFRPLGLSAGSVNRGDPDLAGFSADGDVDVVFSSLSKGLRVHRYSTKTYGLNGGVALGTATLKTLAIIPAANLILATASNGLNVYDLTTGAPVLPEPIKTGIVSPEGVQSADGRTFAMLYAPKADSPRNRIFVWDAAGRKQIADIAPAPKNAKTELTGFALSPDGKTIFAGRGTKIVRIDAATGRELGEW